MADQNRVLSAAARSLMHDCDHVSGKIGNARIALEMLSEEAGFAYDDREKSRMAQERIIVLCQAAMATLDSAMALCDQATEGIRSAMRGADAGGSNG